tara:strand:- start:2994 stop:3152 length:159 start_codon:yes stop_codon:yes gene_type:complete
MGSPLSLAVALAIDALPITQNSGGSPVTNFIVLENGSDRMLTENNLDLMVRE